jgi:ferredoxin
MAKKLKITFPQKCIGCELCIMETQRQLNKAGLEGSLIRVFRNKEERILLGDVSYTIDVNPEINNLKIEKIRNICPTGVFTIEESGDEDEEDLLQ